MANNDNHPGFFIEIMREVDRRLGNETKIEIYPWGRAQSIALMHDNVVLFPIAKTEERADQYSWIEMIKPMQMVFVTIDPAIKSKDEAKALTRILVHKNAPPEFFLRKEGFTNLAKLPDLTHAVPRMLQIGRADAWFTPKDMAEWIWKLNPDVSLPHFSKPFSNHPLMIAGSKNLSPEVIEKIRSVILEMKRDQTIDRLIARYRRGS